MKNLILFLLVCFALNLNAQKKSIPQEKIPSGIVNHLNTEFPKHSKVDWRKTDKGNFKAKFEFPNQKVTITYASSGKWKSTRRALSGEKVPNEILTVISSKYSGYKLKKYTITTRSGKDKKFVATIINKPKEKKTLIFNNKHQFVSEKIKKSKKK